jgi:hypothetical protein
MLDRVGLLIPRLARLGAVSALGHADALNDLRLGVNTAMLRELAGGSDAGPVALAVNALMSHLSAHFGVQERKGQVQPSSALLSALDNTIRQLLALGGGALRLKGLVAATGLRRGLFPEAPPFDDQERTTC